MAATSPTAIAKRLARGLPFGRRSAPKHIWSGVYERFRDADIGAVSYATPAFLDGVEAEARAYLAEAQLGGKLNLWHDGLSLVAGCSVAGQAKLHVVDFGGGLGTGYLQVRQDLPADVLIRYDVVEIADIAARGRRLLSDLAEIAFHDSLDEIAVGPDIVYVNSALQYLEDYEATLDRLAALQPRWLFLDRAAVGDVPSFVTVQMNVTGKKMRYWFLSKREVVEILARRGFRLVHEAQVGPEYDQRNLPATHRIGRMRRLLFRGTDPAASAERR